MSNVAMNLVATMMQRSFSGNSGYIESGSKLSQSNFSSVMKQTKVSFETNRGEDTIGKSVDKIHLKIREKVNAGSKNTMKDQDQLTAVVNDNKDVSQLSEPLKQENSQVKEISDSEEIKETSETIETKEVKGLDDKEEKTVTTNEEEQAIEDLAKALNITPEELQEVLTQLQMTLMDLVDVNNLKEFVTKLMGLEDSIELLTTEGALEKLQKASGSIQNSINENPELMKQVAGNNRENGQGQSPVDSEVVNKNIFEDLKNNISGQGQQNQQSSNSQTPQDGTTSTLGNSSQSQSTQVQNPTVNGFEGALSEVIAQKTETIVMNGQVQTIYTEVTAKDIFEQIVTGIKLEVSESKTNITLQLQPESLGKIAFNLSSVNGTLTGHFVAESEAVKNIIEANIAQLKAQLVSRGIEVSDIKISVGNTTSFFTGDNNNSTNHQESNKSNKRFKIGNINQILADTISDKDLENEESGLHENSSIELQA